AKRPAESPGRPGRPDPASSVASIADCYRRSLRPRLGPPGAPRRRATFRQSRLELFHTWRYTRRVKAPERESAANGAVSPGGPVDVAALFAQLRKDARGASGHDLEQVFDRGVVRTRLRTVAERWWPVSVDRPLERRPGLKGAVL